MGLIGRLFGTQQQVQGTGQTPAPAPPTTSTPAGEQAANPQTGKDEVTLSPGAQALTDPTNPLYHTNGLGSIATQMW